VAADQRWFVQYVVVLFSEWASFVQELTLLILECKPHNAGTWTRGAGLIVCFGALKTLMVTFSSISSCILWHALRLDHRSFESQTSLIDILFISILD